MGQREGAADARADPGQGGEQRQPGGNHGAERDDEDQGRHGEADDLPDADDLGDLLQGGARKHGHPRFFRRCLRRCDGVGHGALGELEQLVLELELEQRDAAVLGHHHARDRPAVHDQCSRRDSRRAGRLRYVARGTGCGRAPWLSGSGQFGRIHDRLDPVDALNGLGDHRGEPVRVETLAGRRLEHQRTLTAAHFREFPGQFVDHLLGRCPVDAELRAQLGGIEGQCADERDQQHHPHRDHTERVPIRHPPHPVQQCRHRSPQSRSVRHGSHEGTVEDQK